MIQTRPARRITLPTTLDGASAVAWDIDALDTFVPYFYNPALDPSGRHLLCAGDESDTEQVWIIDTQTDTARRLTDAHGTGQHWSPYIRTPIAGIRPQFICWQQPEFRHVVFWENNDLCRVDIESGTVERLLTLDADLIPAVPNCSPHGWLGFGTSPRSLHERLRAGASVVELETDLETGCGYVVYDLANDRLVTRQDTSFWPNHVSIAPDHRHVLLCHEGDWKRQRMYLAGLPTPDIRPLREQDDGSRVGHEFWIDANRVAYHGGVDDRSFFGIVDVDTSERREYPSPPGEHGAYAHYHLSPDGDHIVTDGEVTLDRLSIATLGAGASDLEFRPIVAHDWDRAADQRFHPHPHWHADGRSISFTNCHANGRRRVALLTLP